MLRCCASLWVLFTILIFFKALHRLVGLLVISHWCFHWFLQVILVFRFLLRCSLIIHYASDPRKIMKIIKNTRNIDVIRSCCFHLCGHVGYTLLFTLHWFLFMFNSLCLVDAFDMNCLLFRAQYIESLCLLMAIKSHKHIEPSRARLSTSIYRSKSFTFKQSPILF